MDPAALLITGALMTSMTYAVGVLRRQRRVERAWRAVAHAAAGTLGGPERLRLRLDGVDVEVVGTGGREGRTRIDARAPGLHGWRARLVAAGGELGILDAS